MRLALVAAAAAATVGLLSAGAHATSGEDDERPAARLVVTAVPLTAPVKAGTEQRATLVLEMRDGAYHEPKAPCAIALAGGGTVTPVKATLGRADATDPATKDKKASRLEFAVPFKAGAAGGGRLEATVSLYVCYGKFCDPVDRTVVWEIRAK